MSPDEKVARVLEVLEYDLAAEFARRVNLILRRLSDREINELYLLTHTASHCGDYVHYTTAALMPLIDRESDVRRDIAFFPNIGPAIAPELYEKGGPHDLPF